MRCSEMGKPRCKDSRDCEWVNKKCQEKKVKFAPAPALAFDESGDEAGGEAGAR